MFLNIAKNLVGPGGKLIFFTGSNINDEDYWKNGKMIEVVDVLHPTLVCDKNGTVPVGIANVYLYRYTYSPKN